MTPSLTQLIEDLRSVSHVLDHNSDFILASGMMTDGSKLKIKIYPAQRDHELDRVEVYDFDDLSRPIHTEDFEDHAEVLAYVSQLQGIPTLAGTACGTI